MSDTITADVQAEIRAWRAVNVPARLQALKDGDTATLERLNAEADALVTRLGQAMTIDEVLNGNTADDGAAAPEANADGEATVTEPHTPTTGEKIPRYIAIMVTPEQYKAVKAFAGDRAISGVCLQTLADTMGFTVADTIRKGRKKYNSEEEAKEARKQQAKSHAEEVKQALAFFRAQQALQAKQAAEVNTNA